MFFVYVLYSEGGGLYYYGQTNNLKRRLAEHNRGKVKSTQGFRPYILVWACLKNNRQEALKLEKKLKNLRSQSRIRKFIHKYSDDFDKIAKYL